MTTCNLALVVTVILINRQVSFHDLFRIEFWNSYELKGIHLWDPMIRKLSCHPFLVFVFLADSLRELLLLLVSTVACPRRSRKPRSRDLSSR